MHIKENAAKKKVVKDSEISESHWTGKVGKSEIPIQTMTARRDN